MGLFDGIAQAQVFERGKYLPGGFRGKLKVVRTLAKDTQRSGAGFIVELEIVESNLPEPYGPGDKCTWYVKLTDKNTAFPNIKAFVSALCGYSVSQKAEIEAKVSPILQGLVEQACSNPDRPEANPLLGRIIGLETVTVSTKPTATEPTGHVFTRHDWHPVT